MKLIHMRTVQIVALVLLPGMLLGLLTGVRAAEAPGAAQSPDAAVGYYGLRAGLIPEAQNLYRLLEESTDNDGELDYLIRDRYFAPGTGTWTPSAGDAGCVVRSERGSDLVVAVLPGKGEILEPLRTGLVAFLADHPEVVWLDGLRLKQVSGRDAWGNPVTWYALELSGDRGDARGEAWRSEEVIREYLARLDRAAGAILSGIPEGASRQETVAFLNGWLTLHNSYCSLPGPFPPASGDPLTALQGSFGSAGPTCGGYAGAFTLLCHAAGIPCLEVCGTVGESDALHAWNLVQMEDGEWYAVDVTWNDPAVGNFWQTGPVSGYEDAQILLAGSETVSCEGRFGDHHRVLSGMPDTGIPLPRLSARAWSAG